MNRMQTCADIFSSHADGMIGLPQFGRPKTPARSGLASMNKGGIGELRPDRLRVEIAEEGRHGALSCVILSERGMYLHTSRPFPERTVLRLRFTLPHSLETLEVSGEVTPMALCGIDAGNGQGTGVIFTDLPERVRQQIKNFIEWETADVHEWDPDPSEFTPIEDFDVLVQAVLFFGPRPQSPTVITRFPASPQMENALRLSLVGS
jgi:hypothetical protein